MGKRRAVIHNLVTDYGVVRLRQSAGMWILDNGEVLTPEEYVRLRRGIDGVVLGEDGMWHYTRRPRLGERSKMLV